MATPARGVNEATSTAVDHAHAPPEPSAPITVTEGGAVLHFRSRKEVFYNYVQCTNRDLSMIMTKVFADIRALEAAEKGARARARAAAAAAFRVTAIRRVDCLNSWVPCSDVVNVLG